MHLIFPDAHRFGQQSHCNQSENLPSVNWSSNTMAFRGRIQLLCLGRKTACPGPTRCEYALKANSLAAQLNPYEYAQSVAAQAGSPPFRRTAPGVPANWGKTHFDVARPDVTALMYQEGYRTGGGPECRIPVGVFQPRGLGFVYGVLAGWRRGARPPGLISPTVPRP